jgi:subtilase family serine protease
MLSFSWPRRIVARFGKKSCSRRQIERLQVAPSLEWLEKRELLTTATPFVVNSTQEQAAPLLSSGSSGYTPSQIGHAYGFDKITFDNGTVKGDGSGQTIAIVSAYDDPNIVNDLNAFDMQFKLPAASLSVLNQVGGAVLPEADPTGAWESEDALDVEWAHAMAPGANLMLVEANSDNLSDLLAAARTAADVPGVSVVSMSWGNAEVQNEINYDDIFTTPAGHTGVTFVASSGDSGAPPIYPAVSPNVLAVGGTTLTVDSLGNWVSETAWSGSGGGISAYEPQPSYQHGVVSQSLTQRTSPDVAYDANSATGFAVYDSYSANGGPDGWTDIAGTSAGAPQWAALIAIANQGRALAGEPTLDGPSQTLPMIYQMPATNFHDILTGSSTGKPAYSAGPGYDLVTGRGSPLADQVVYYLVGSSVSPQDGGPSSGSGSGPSQTSGGNLLQDGGFGQPSVGANQLLNPTGSPWLFLGMSGIAGNGSTLTAGNAPAPVGNQVAFLFNAGSSILQSVSLAPGTYTFSFQAAQLGTIAYSQEQIEVVLGGTIVMSVTPGLSYNTYTGTFTVGSAGNYTLQFGGMVTKPVDGSTSYGDAALLDDVTLQGGVPKTGPTSPSSPPASPPPPPSQSHSPAPSPAPSPPPSSSSAGTDQSSASDGQLTQDNPDAFMQSVLSSLYDLLLNDLLLIQAELNQFLQASNPTASIQLVPNVNGLPQLDALGLLWQRWQWVDQLLSGATEQI